MAKHADNTAIYLGWHVTLAVGPCLWPASSVARRVDTCTTQYILLSSSSSLILYCLTQYSPLPPSLTPSSFLALCRHQSRKKMMARQARLSLLNKKETTCKQPPPFKSLFSSTLTSHTFAAPIPLANLIHTWSTSLLHPSVFYVLRSLRFHLI